MNEAELKSILSQYKESNFQQLGPVPLPTLVKAMLDYIGSTDPELRDSLIYPCFTNLIINGHFPPPELNRIVTVCLDDHHLFYKINEPDEDAVFTRSFSSLILAVLLFVNRQKPFIADEEIDQITNKMIHYVKKEEDVRGFVEVKGWAHSIAHIADALDELVKQPQLKESRLEDIALLILDKMCFDKAYFLFEEDERMVVPFISLLERGMNPLFLYEKIDKIVMELQQNYSQHSSKPFIQRNNIKQFLRSLLLHLEVIGKKEEFREHLKNALIAINQPYYNL
ncbi:DUF2785 domain-containing protein [Ornithinibacillus sp. BX22]|uniref:DUF2785 domain-containing protein n=2 Tax=Ornithinibacillus TaxID=484508 RepID=A0A923RHV8_9BACI|nr:MULTISPECIES: DUF2785 domain-containing protein [Ornithinibacillus]MBC5636814.1 DUF2785 domain-containing protein [Ornithinibacillus hominis]MBS3681380.1 DUF2785 domain-containing protein [Ornithinibacillus massiliensis]